MPQEHLDHILLFIIKAVQRKRLELTSKATLEALMIIKNLSYYLKTSLVLKLKLVGNGSCKNLSWKILSGRFKSTPTTKETPVISIFVVTVINAQRRQFSSEYFSLNVKFCTICKMFPQSLENCVYKGSLHMIIDLELFQMSLFSCSTVLISSNVFVIYYLDTILEEFYCHLSFIF